MQTETATEQVIQSENLNPWNIDALLSQVTEVWEHGFMGINIGQIIVAILIFAAFMLIRGLFSKYILHKLHNLASETDTNLDDKIIDALIPPIRFVPIIMGIFFAGQFLGIDESMPILFGRVLKSLIAFIIFWGLYRSIEPLNHLSGRLSKVLTKMMVDWIFRVMRVLIVLIAGAVILEIWGIEVGPLLAGFGLFGAAVALGAQDLFKNLIGGITIIAEKRFQPGEWIKVEGIVEGTVEDIGFRSTKVRRFDKAPVHVPNSQLSDAAVTNFSRMTNRRIYWKIGVVYSTTVEQLKIIRDEITSYIQNNEEFEKPEKVSTFVRIDSFNESSIDIMVYCFTKTTVWGKWLEIKERLAMTIKEIIEEKAGTSFAFPSTSVYMEQWPEELPEDFIVPTSQPTIKQ